MAAQIFDICRNGSFVGMSVKINDPIMSHRTRKQFRTRQTSSKFVKHIDLNFKVQLKCSHFQVYEDGSTTATSFLHEHTSPQHPFATYQLPISIFKHGDKTLEQYLFQEFHMYRDFINIRLVADTIIQHWVKRVEEDDRDHQDDTNNNFIVFRKIYPLEITLEMLIYRRYAIESVVTMVPTSDSAMESMLRKVENEVIMELCCHDDDDDGINCVICLEEIGKEEEGSERLVLQMPCLHMFHGECIIKWLKTSHYCPTCRFSMPTSN